MAILRKHQRGQYTVIDNTIFRDSELSNKALGMLCRMLSLPDGWEFSVMGLASLSNDGKSAVMSQLDELEEHGYLVRNQVRVDGKIAGVEYIVSEVRMSEKPYAENQHTENQHTENPTLSINNISNTYISNTKDINIDYSHDDGKKHPRFSKPTVDEVSQYINEQGYHIDAETFIDYYESKGWLVGKSKMKDWKATVRNWERRREKSEGAKTPINPFMQMLETGDY